MSAAVEELRALVATAGRVLTALGLVDYLGHASARVPGTDHVVVKPKHSPTVRGMAALGAGRFCHLQGHGIVSVAGDLREATVGAAMLEQLAEAALTAAATGAKLRTITPTEISTLRSQVAGVEGRWAYFCELAGIEAA